MQISRFGCGAALVMATVIVASPAVAASLASAPWIVVATPVMSSDTTQTVVKSVSAVASGRVFAAGYTEHFVAGTFEWRNLIEHSTPSGWQVLPTPDIETEPATDELFGVAGSAANDVWAVGMSGTTVGSVQTVPAALHYDGVSWSYVPVPSPGNGAVMTAVVSLGRSNVWAAGDSSGFESTPAFFYYDGHAWTSRAVPAPSGCTQFGVAVMTAIVATPAGQLYAGGHCQASGGEMSYVMHHTGAAWPVVARGLPGTTLNAMTATARGQVWAVGYRQVSSPIQAVGGFAIFGSARTWTQRYRPLVNLRSEVFAGVAWTPAGIVAVGSNGPYAGAGTRPEVVTWSGSTWQQNQIRPAQNGEAWLSVVTSDASGDTWALGQAFDASGHLIATAAHPSNVHQE